MSSISDLSFEEMDNHMNQLVQIAHNIGQAYTDDANGLIRLYLTMAIALLQGLITDLNEYMLNVESIGEQPHEVYNFANMPDIDYIILNFEF